MQPPTPATTGEIVHRLPGRLRVRIPQLRYDSTEPTKLKQSLSALTGVTEVRVNSAASSIVITYQVDRLTEPALLTHLGLTTPPDVPSRFDATQSNQTTRSDSKQEHKEHLKEEIGEVIGADFGEAVGEVVGEGIGALLGVSGAWVGGGIGGAIGEAVGEKLGDAAAREPDAHEAESRELSLADEGKEIEEMTAKIVGTSTGEMIGEVVGEAVGGLLMGPAGMAIGAELGAVLGEELGEAIAKDVERQLEETVASEPPSSSRKPTRRKK